MAHFILEKASYQGHGRTSLISGVVNWPFLKGAVPWPWVGEETHQGGPLPGKGAGGGRGVVPGDLGKPLPFLGLKLPLSFLGLL